MVVSAAAANWDLSDDEKVEVEEKTVPTLRKRKQAAAKTQAKGEIYPHETAAELMVVAQSSH